MPREKVYASDAERQQAYRNRKAETDKERSLQRAAYGLVLDELFEAGLVTAEATTVQVLGAVRQLITWWEQNPDARYVTESGEAVTAEEYERYQLGGKRRNP